MKNKGLLRNFDQNRIRQLGFCLVVTFLVGILAHGYAFFNDSFSHDSLNALYADSDENTWMISLGRFMVPVYRMLFRGPIAIPWLIGVLTLLWLGLSVFFIAETFKTYSKWAVFLIAAVLVTNRTITAWAGTYIFLLDTTAFGVLLSVIAVYLWKTCPKGFLWGSPFILAALGVYQSNISVTVTLILMLSVLELLEGTSVKQVLLKGILGIVMIGVGAVAYVVCNKAVQSLTHIAAADTYNSLSRMITSSLPLWARFAAPYYEVFRSYRSPVSPWPSSIIFIMTLLACAVAVILEACGIRKKGVAPGAVGLAAGLAVLLPLGMDTSAFLMGRTHDLMRFAFWFVYIFAIIIFERHLPQCKNNKTRLCIYVCAALTGCVLWNNITVSNTVYLKKNLEKEGALSLMTRVVAEMEDIPEYTPGETPVAFIGSRNGADMPGFSRYGDITGANYSNPITGIDEENHFNTYEAYFYYFLNEPIALCDESQRQALLQDQRVAEMPVFPEDLSVQMIDGVLVVKIAEE